MNWLRGTGFRALAALLMMGALLGVPAFAQVAKAPGFKIGEGRLHPFLELDARYDSLVGFFSRDSAGNPVPSGELIFHIRPGLSFDLDNPSTLVSFKGSGEYLWYTGLISPGGVGLSRFQANVGLDTKFNRDGAAEVNLGDNLVRSDRTQNPSAGVGVISLFNNVYLGVPIHPGGRALEVTPKVGWTVEFFDPLLSGPVQGCPAGDITCNPALVSQMNYSNVNFDLNGRWKFLPKTAVILDANLDWRTYFSGAGTTNPLATILRVQAGLAGLISPRIAVTLLVGYGGDLARHSINTVIGTAEFSYTVTEQSRIAIGYMRNAIPVPAIGTMVGRLLLNAQVSADYFSYLSTTARNDFLISASAGPTFTVTSWFDVSAGYTLGFRTSTVTVQSVNFVRHEVMLRLAFHY
jgi:hypothetical protein